MTRFHKLAFSFQLYQLVKNKRKLSKLVNGTLYFFLVGFTWHDDNSQKSACVNEHFLERSISPKLFTDMVFESKCFLYLLFL